MNTLEFLGGGRSDQSPRCGHSPRMRSRGSGDEGSLPNFFRMRVISYSLKHISTGEHSLLISWGSTHLLHLYFLFSWWRHQMEACSASLAFVRGIHWWLRGIHRSPVNSPHTDQWRGAACYAYYQYHQQYLLYNRDGRKRRRSYTYHTWQQSYSLWAYLSAGDRLCVCKKITRPK